MKERISKLSEGYYRESRSSSRIYGSHAPVSGLSAPTLNSSNLRVQETISFRDNSRGTPVSEVSFDPYKTFLRNRTLDKTAGRPILKNRHHGVPKNSCLYDPLWDPAQLRDTGHAFHTKESRAWTSLPGRNMWYYPTSTSAQRIGGPVFTSLATVAGDQWLRMPFHFSGSNLRRFQPNNIPATPSSVALDTFGKEAINAVAPAQPSLDLFAAFGELALAMPKVVGHSFATLIGSPRDLGRAVGSEYLNVVFGLTPTFRDIQSFIEVLTQYSELLMQLRRDAGRAVRRRYTIPTVTKLETFSGTQLENQGRVSVGAQLGYDHRGETSTAGFVYSTGVASTLTMGYQEKLWFHGSFSYYIPVGDRLVANLETYLNEADKIIRIRPDLSSVWQLIPWSWLVDWFLDVGSSLELAKKAQDDNLVINYGYAMRSIKWTARCRTELTYAPSKKSSMTHVSSGFVVSSKQRIRANPYGFILPSKLSVNENQVAIAVAVGLSGGHKLNIN